MPYEIDAGAGDRWLELLREQLPQESQQVLRMRPELREARDESTIFLIIVVVRDEIRRLPPPDLRALLKTLESNVRHVVLGDGYTPVEGWPLVSFRTEAEDPVHGARP